MTTIRFKNPNYAPKKMGPMTKEERLALARRRQQQLVAAGVRPQYMPMSGSKNTNELKGVGGILDLNPVLATTNSNGGAYIINLVQQGAGSWNRIGRKIRLRSVRMKGIVQFTNGAAGPWMQNCCRMVLVYDKQPSGNAVPTFDTIFGETDQSGTEASGFLYNVRYDNTGRFSVIKDTMTWSQLNINAQAQWEVPFDVFVNLKKLETIYSGQTVPMTIADISSGALYCFFRAQQNDATQQVAIVNSTFRLRYED